MIERGFNVLLKPVEISVRSVRQLGGTLLRSVHSPRLGNHLAEHHYEDQLAIVKAEGDKMRESDTIAQMSAVRIHNLTLQHYLETKEGPEPMSEAYIDQVSRIMEDCGVPQTTIAEVMGNPATLESLAEAQYNPTS